MHSIKIPMAIGQTISYSVGRVEITLQFVREGAYTVTTMQGGTLRIDDNCGSYSTEDEARKVARLYAETYRAEYIDELTQELRAAERRRDYNRVDRIHSELDRLDTPAQAKADRQTLADMAETIRTGRPTRTLSGFGQLKAAHAAGMQRARTEVA